MKTIKVPKSMPLVRFVILALLSGLGPPFSVAELSNSLFSSSAALMNSL